MTKFVMCAIKQEMGKISEAEIKTTYTERSTDVYGYNKDIVQE